MTKSSSLSIWFNSIDYFENCLIEKKGIEGMSANLIIGHGKLYNSYSGSIVEE